MPPPWPYSEHNLKPDEAALITRYANGRALEFGSGRGLGTHALLAGRIDHIVSIDEDESFTQECRARFTDPRVKWVFLGLNTQGWYDHGQVPEPEEPEDKYTTVILDGPSGTFGRGFCLPMLLDLEHSYLAPDWQLLVTRTALPAVKDFIEDWLKRFAVKLEILYCDRGMIRITPV